MNEENKTDPVSDTKDHEQNLPSDGTAEVKGTEKVQTSESETGTLETTILVEHFEHIESQLDKLTAIGIVLIVALGLIFGGFACKSFFEHMR